MLVDWLWSLAVVLLIWLEIGGWTRLARRLAQSRQSRARKTALPKEVAYTLGFAASAQAYFVLSLTELGRPMLHLALLGLGCASFFLAKPRDLSTSPLKLARSVSPLTWKRALPWLALPSLWIVLRLLDTFVPHNQPQALSISLLAPHRWLEEGRQQLDPFNPNDGLAAIWEGLYYHVESVIHAIHGSWRASGSPHRTALVRAQLTCQMLHFAAQMLCVLVMAGLIRPFIRAGWDVLLHSNAAPDDARSRRHALGTAGAVAVPSSLCFAWLACAMTPDSSVAIFARTEWGSVLFAFGAVAAVAAGRWNAGWFLAGSAVATIPGLGLGAWMVFPGMLAANALAATSWMATTERRRGALLARTLAAALACFLAGLLPWAFRNAIEAGRWLYPPLREGTGPGWGLSQLLGALTNTMPLTAPVVFVLATGLAGFAVYLYRRRGRIEDPGLGLLVAFALGSASLLPWARPAPYFLVAFLMLAVLGIEFLITIVRHPIMTGAARFVPYFWVMTGIITVPLPFHVVWQHLSYAFSPDESYLSLYHPHYEAKHWASVQLPAGSSVAWTHDDQFYYLEHRGVSIADSRILKETLARKSNPRERARVLCELGFDAFAWEDRSHGTEVSGLSSWLKLTPDTILHSSDDVTLFDLREVCKKL